MPQALAPPRGRRRLRWPVPGQCAVCRRWCAGAFCGPCIARFAAPAARCARCGLRSGATAAVCGACLAVPPPYDGCVVACDYAFPWDRLIAGFKFDGRVELAAPLAALLVEAVRARGLETPEMVLPLPLAPRRLAERGYNQAWELARRVAKHLQLPARADRLERLIDGPHQAQLGLAQRQRGPRGAFLVRPAQRAALHGRRVALVDDVMTSGATVGAAATALRRAGAASVQAWVLARTPDPADRG